MLAILFMPQVLTSISWIQEFPRSYNMTSHQIPKWPPGKGWDKEQATTMATRVESLANRQQGTLQSKYWYYMFLQKFNRLIMLFWKLCKIMSNITNNMVNKTLLGGQKNYNIESTDTDVKITTIYNHYFRKWLCCGNYIKFKYYHKNCMKLSTIITVKYTYLKL